MAFRIKSCRTLYLRASLATRQLLRTCRRDWFSWQRGQDGFSLFFQRHKLALCGSTSTAAFMANFSCSSGKDRTTRGQMGAQLGLVHLLSCPCLSRDWRWSTREELTSSTTAAFANFTRDFLLPPGLIFRASLATSAGQNFCRFDLNSRLRPRSARNRTQES